MKTPLLHIFAEAQALQIHFYPEIEDVHAADLKMLSPRYRCVVKAKRHV